MSEVGGLLATGSGDWQARIFKITGMDEAPAASASGSAKAATAPTNAAPKPAMTESQQPGASASLVPAKQQPAAPVQTEKKEGQPELKQENGTSEVNGSHQSKEASAAPASKETPVASKETSSAPAGEPSSPGAMKVDLPEEAAPSEKQKTAPKEAASEETAIKEGQEDQTDARKADTKTGSNGSAPVSAAAAST